jgi:hypothetical protein
MANFPDRQPLPPIEVTTIRLQWPEGVAAIREGLAVLARTIKQEVTEMAKIDDDIAALATAITDNDNANASVLQAFTTINQMYITALADARTAGVPSEALQSLETAVAKVQANTQALTDAALANTKAASDATSTITGGTSTVGGGVDTRPPFDPTDPTNPNNQPDPNVTVAGGASTVTGA